jgi:hypothetical protein
MAINEEGCGMSPASFFLFMFEARFKGVCGVPTGNPVVSPDESQTVKSIEF